MDRIVIEKKSEKAAVINCYTLEDLNNVRYSEMYEYIGAAWDCTQRYGNPIVYYFREK